MSLFLASTVRSDKIRDAERVGVFTTRGKLSNEYNILSKKEEIGVESRAIL
jgi:hypothetical protein